MDKETLELLRMLIARLERIPADSYWAHRASGARGSLLKLQYNAENGRSVSHSRLKRAMDTGFLLLKYAARKSSS